MTRPSMKPLADAAPADFEHVALVLTDMDDTLTFDGRLAADTYTALERLEQAGVRVVPITAAPAGWCDQMVRMWPLSAVIGENGGFCFTRRGHGVERAFWLPPPALADATARLADIGRAVIAAHPAAQLSDDQPFRLTSLAIARPADGALARSVAQHLKSAGADTTLNSIWVLAWFGGYDKIRAARKFLPAATGLDVDLDRDRIVFVGDSANDAPLFAHFPKAAGVSTVTAHLADIPQPPTWLTRGAGGAGFVEVADAILSARRSRVARIVATRPA